ncbi:nickel/cobalt transporter [Kibdelosporangium persicum]|uniref:ABC-type nickel/cobalt efflux system permease component RcnA n=1 Tax=Kibdelosporangium persicum TaxID=2698649 RepID=A0ABX2EVV4_9PSEU|nr:High-affinity nickel-transporter [Kibdelosporangium persicum]NRN62893.1 ABC-type nickel/cobalt efflux system permease component RcnA [Kibdelosporangium persicum]
MTKRLVLMVLGLVLLWPSGTASAHPLGNFSVNHYHGLHLRPDRVDVRSVVDFAEIPTLQEKPGDAGRECRDLAGSVRATVDSQRLALSVRRAQLEFPRGQADLSTSRLTCELTAPAEIRGPVRLAFTDSYRPDRVGWHEITAVGTDVRVDSAVPARSVSDELRSYPEDLLSSPLDVRSVELMAEPGLGSAPASAVVPVQGESGLAAAFNDIVGTADLTLWLGLLAVLLALVLGASHAALPGHGKTVIAAYLVGRRGTPKDAVLVGATVTLTHTAGVLVLGLLISVSSVLAGEAVLRWLGVASGLLIAGIGIVLMRSALRGRRAHGHGHGHGHGHFGKAGLVGMGVAGGLVPSPSALVVLLGAIALGRTWFGVLLVLAYGLGMAGTLTAAGLLLVKLRDRMDGLSDRIQRYTKLVPVMTSAMVLLVGSGLAVRGLAA